MNQPSPPKATGHMEAGNTLFGSVTGGMEQCWDQGVVCELMLSQMGLEHLQATENLARSFYCFPIPALKIPVHPASLSSRSPLRTPALIGTHLGFGALLMTRTV